MTVFFSQRASGSTASGRQSRRSVVDDEASVIRMAKRLMEEDNAFDTECSNLMKQLVEKRR